jgi:hypothetical protein
MKTGIVCVTILLTLVLLRGPGEGGGGGQTSPHETVAKDMLDTLGQITTVLVNIKDEPSADAARPDLKKAAVRMQDLRKRAKEMKQPTKEEKDALERRYKDKFDDALKKLRTESLRVKGIPGGAEALKEIAVVTEKKKK